MTPLPAAPPRQDETLAHAFGIVRRRWLIVALAVAACIAAAFGQRALATHQ
jgi:hypothetical protein